MPKIRAIKNHIIFQFEDAVVRKSDMGRERTQFSESTDWGFETSNYDESTKKPRWCKVISVGPSVKEDINVGALVLVEALQWTEAVVVDGISYWRTDEDALLAIDTSTE